MKPPWRCIWAPPSHSGRYDSCAPDICRRPYGGVGRCPWSRYPSRTEDIIYDAFAADQARNVGGYPGVLGMDRLGHPYTTGDAASRSAGSSRSDLPAPPGIQTNIAATENPSTGARSVASENALPHASPPEEEHTPSVPFAARVPRVVTSRRIDLNHATASDLEALPGIGPKLAQRVIDHRRSHGPFTKVEDLRQVKGIGHKKFDRLRPHVLVTNTRSPSRHKGT